MKKRILALLLACCMLLGFSVTASAVSDDLQTAVNDTAKYLQNTIGTPQVGNIGGDFVVIGLARSGCAVPQSYWDNYYASARKNLTDSKGVLSTVKYNEYSRLILGLTAVGANPADVAGYNLLTYLGDFEKVNLQGINGTAWALIALDSGNYDIPKCPEAAVQATRQMYVDRLLEQQLKNGGWVLGGKGGGTNPADPDITAMVLQALSNYQDQPAVKTAVSKALTCLSGIQNSQGGYASWGFVNSESTAQVIIALCELGVSLEDSRFIKNGNSLLDNLLTYRTADGGFKHTQDENAADQLATDQAFCAMAAALRAEKGGASLYDMSDVTISVDGGKGLPGKHADVKTVPVTAPGTSFSDIAGHKNQAAVESLAARKIIDGMGDGTFAPNATMTRAQFAAIAVRALGLTPKYVNAFKDVPSNKWYSSYIGTAYSYGLINGMGDGNFAPGDFITRQQAASLVMRAAKLCGVTLTLDDTGIRNVLAQFDDYMTVSAWAKEGLAFCYATDILDQSDLSIRPKANILRCELSQMLYNLLEVAELL